MSSESIVYGCIKDSADENIVERRRINLQALSELPAAESWPMISREMFSARTAPDEVESGPLLNTEITHFGASYQGVEYEWKHWLEQFEQLLRQMYWVSATVHLETEMAGTHSFFWQTDCGEHQPGVDDIKIRCEWIHDA